MPRAQARRTYFCVYIQIMAKGSLTGTIGDIITNIIGISELLLGAWFIQASLSSQTTFRPTAALLKKIFMVILLAILIFNHLTMQLPCWAWSQTPQDGGADWGRGDCI